MVGWRNPARYLAPLALAAAGTATYLIIHHAVAPKHVALPTLSSTTNAVRAPATHRVSSSNKPKFYVVRPNDTLSRIAVKTGVSVGTLEALNQNINPNALHPSQRLRLRR